MGWADATSELDRNQAQQTDTKQKQAGLWKSWYGGPQTGKYSEITAIRQSRKDIATIEVMVI